MACAVVTSITGDSLFALIVLALLEPVLHAPAKSATAKSIKSAGVKIRITFMNSLPLGGEMSKLDPGVYFKTPRRMISAKFLAASSLEIFNKRRFLSQRILFSECWIIIPRNALTAIFGSISRMAPSACLVFM